MRNTPVPTRHCLFRLGPLFLACACADVGPQAAFSVRDSAGVRIVESLRPEWEAAGEWLLSSDPVLQIGERDGEEVLQLFGITGGLRLIDGRMAVLNSGSNTVRIFGEDGGFITEFGGSGDGPGEFRSIDSIHELPGDTLLVWDHLRPGLSVFTATGEFVRFERLTPPGSEQIAGVEPLPDGRLVVKTYVGSLTSGGDLGVGIHRDLAPLLLYSREGELLDTIGMFPSTETMIIELSGRPGAGVPPFPKTTWVSVQGTSIYVGTADDMEVSVLRPDGSAQEIYRYPNVDLAVTQEDRDWFADRMTEAAATPQEQQLLPMVLSALIFPETRAAYSDLRVDRSGSIWVRTGRHYLPYAPSREWTVFSDEGILLGALQLPDRFDVLEFGPDYVLGVWKDEMDVEYVRLHALVRGGSSSGEPEDDRS